LIVYHRTSSSTAGAILAEGFRDSEGYYMTAGDEDGKPWRGVWVSEEVFDASSLGIAWGEGVVLALSMPEDLLAQWEWVEEGKGYREFLVPAEILNASGRPRVIRDERRHRRRLP
jgi:hypothetical protein